MMVANRLSKRTALPKWAQERLMVAVIRQCKATEVCEHAKGYPFDMYLTPELKRRNFE